MKLVDILARELKVWPEGCGFVGQASDETLHMNNCKNYSDSPRWTDEKYTKAEDWARSLVSRAEWQAAVDALNAPKVVEWDGKGNPPAGSTCQIRHSGWDAGSWKTADIKYISSEYLIIRHGNFKREQHFHMPDIQFRPILTAEQVAAVEREKAINEMVFGVCGCEPDGGNTTAFMICGFIYDAGYRKQVLK